MKITRRQLKRIIKEEISEYASERPNNPMERAYARHVEDYEAWVFDHDMGRNVNKASVLATYLVSQELDQNAERVGILASEYKVDKKTLSDELRRQKVEYDAGGLESEEENYERGFFRESKIKITKRQLKRIIKEEKAKLLNENQSQHRCFDGTLVPFGSSECLEDLHMRKDDATDLRNSCPTRTDKRDYYNGILKVLRRDIHDAQKENVLMHGEEI